MDKIQEFIYNRPKVLAAYAYGSKIFKQDNADNTNSLIDLILVVDDIKKWHIENMKINPNDYSTMGANFFKNASKETIKGNTGIAYISDIEENNLKFKYGTIEYKDLLYYLQTWKSFYMPGRFQKTIYPYKEDIELKEAIQRNRNRALLIATYLQNEEYINKNDLLKTLVSLSYMGDTRMSIAENPNKINNLVNGSYQEYNKIYNFNTSFSVDNDEVVVIKKSTINNEINRLPFSLNEYLKCNNDNDKKEMIIKYLTDLNKKESLEMTIKGLKTNGLTRSLKYAKRKIEKRFK